MNIVIKTIPHREQRYDTAGDWFFDESGDLQIRVSKMERRHSGSGRRRMEWLIAVHELIEALLCAHRGVSDEEVTAFDKAFLEAHQLDSEEPGDDPASPYREEHFFATTIERLLATELRIDWHDYDDAIAELSDGQT